MAKISARGARPVLTLISSGGERRLVLCSDGRLLEGYRRAGGGYSYVVIRRYRRQGIDNAILLLRDSAREHGSDVREEPR